jgi:hypothetical protein
VLTGLKDRIWITHQAALEFVRNRPKVMVEQSIAFDRVSGKISSLLAELEKELEKYKAGKVKHPYFANAEELTKIITQAVEKTEASIAEAKAQFPSVGTDKLYDELAPILDGKIGPPFSQDELEAIYKEGEERYKQLTPPGYEDLKEKDGTAVYGDLVVWKQLLAYATSKHIPIIFVTDEEKEDWWWVIGGRPGRTIGPRHELVAEMRKEADVQFYMYRPERFVEYAQEFLGITDENTPQVISEVREVSDELQSRALEALEILSRAAQLRITAEALNAARAQDEEYLNALGDDWRSSFSPAVEDMGLFLARKEAHRNAYVRNKVGNIIVSITEENLPLERITLRELAEEVTKRIPDIVSEREIGAAVEWFQEKGCLKIYYLYNNTGDTIISEFLNVNEISPSNIHFSLAILRSQLQP